jgi:flagellar basal body-associated protein FliL
MADTDDKKKKKEQLKAEKLAKKEAKNAGKSEQTAESGSGIGLVVWIVIAAVAVLGAASGFFAGRLFARNETPQTLHNDAAPDDAQNTEKTDEKQTNKNDDGKTWFLPMNPVVGNLNEPGAMRFVRVTITLEINSELEQTDGSKLVEEKIPILTDWLTIYLSSLSIDDTAGGKNKKRIQVRILDAFNEMLFTDEKPLIKKIHLMEFIIN